MIRTRFQESLETIICHEMKHFDQYEKDDSGLAVIYRSQVCTVGTVKRI